ncbi:MAG: agmatinase [Spirochaetota bacterium]
MPKSNFGNLPDEYRGYESSMVVIIPVPYDGTSTWIKGADLGPEAIIDASANMELYDLETDSEIYRIGIFTDEPVTEKTTPESMVTAVRERVKRHLAKDKFPIILGGEHSVSLGAVQALRESGDLISVLQLDAHSDMRQEYKGSRYNHACVMARISEMCPCVQVGIRSMDFSEKARIQPEGIFFAEDIYNSTAWIEKAVTHLTERVYITIDLDVFDPSVLPSTGTPEPGGLLWYDVLRLLKTVCIERKIAGFDVVELCPDKNKASDFTAAKLVYKILGYIFGRIAWKRPI